MNLFTSLRTANTWHYNTRYLLQSNCSMPMFHRTSPWHPYCIFRNIKSVRFSTNRTQPTITVTLLAVPTTCQYPALTFRRTSPCTHCFTWTGWPTCSYGTDWRVSVSTGHAMGRDKVRTLHIKASRCNADDSHHQPGGWNTLEVLESSISPLASQPG
jgi:hypothetical protein